MSHQNIELHVLMLALHVSTQLHVSSLGRSMEIFRPLD